MSENNKLWKHKARLPEYIRGVASGKYTIRQAAFSTGYTPSWIWQKKEAYLKYGDAIFTHANVGKPAQNRIKDDIRDKVVLLYTKDFDGVNFSFFLECLHDDYDINISYTTLRSIMKDAGIVSPKHHKKKKHEKLHLPRPRRANEGDLLQIDATPYQWFKWCGDNRYYAMHGGIDDATGKITALYITENECLYGYCEVYRQTILKYGIPRENYMDRSAIFAVTPRGKGKLTIQEQLQGLHEHRTQFQRIMDDLCCRQILAWTPQAKGRVERMWSTLQGRLPQIFKMNNISTIREANKFLEKWLDTKYNKSKFIRQAQSPELYWMTGLDSSELDEILCARFPCKTNANGVFKFNKQSFTIKGARYIACKAIELCISERGLKACLDGRYYDVEMLDFLSDGIDNPSVVLDNIMYEYFLKDMKKESA